MFPAYLNPFEILKNIFMKIRDWISPPQEDSIDEKIMTLTPYRYDRFGGRQLINEVR